MTEKTTNTSRNIEYFCVECISSQGDCDCKVQLLLPVVYTLFRAPTSL